MKTSRFLLFGALAFGLAAAPAVAQERDNCRCSERDGNAVENSYRFRAPRWEGMLGDVGRWSIGRPRLGVSVSVNQSASDDSRGAVVTDVLEDGPADEAGLREGDVITSVDGHSLFEPLSGDAEDDFDLDESIPVQRLLVIARGLEPDQEVEVQYLRGDEQRSATLTTEELGTGGDYSVVVPGLDTKALRERMGKLRLQFEDGRDHGRLFETPEAGGVTVYGGEGTVPRTFSFFGSGSLEGLDLAELNPGLGEYFGTDEGVLVVDVDEDSTLGLEPGDVILEIGGRVTSTPSRVRRILGSYGDDEEITFRIMRDGSEINVAGRLGG